MDITASPDFAAFALASDDSPLRAAIRAAFRRPEPDCLPPLLDAASCPADQAAQVQALAQRLVTALRDKGEHGLVEGLLQGYALPTQEGKLRRIELPEQSAEGVVTGQPMFKLEKAAQEGLFCFGEPRHCHRTLPAAQGGAERDHQQFMKIM